MKVLLEMNLAKGFVYCLTYSFDLASVVSWLFGSQNRIISVPYRHLNVIIVPFPNYLSFLTTASLSFF